MTKKVAIRLSNIGTDFVVIHFGITTITITGRQFEVFANLVSMMKTKLELLRERCKKEENTKN